MAEPKDDVIRVLVENHRRFLAFLEPRLGSREAAEDVLQAAFVKGLEKKDTLRDDESAVAWFYRLLRNAITDRHRRRAAQSRRQTKHEREVVAAESRRDEKDLERVVCECLDELVPTLKPEYATILRRADLEGVAVPELATELGITPNNAGVRLHRARLALKKQLELTCGTCTDHGCLDCTCGQGGGPTPRRKDR